MGRAQEADVSGKPIPNDASTLGQDSLAQSANPHAHTCTATRTHAQRHTHTTDTYEAKRRPAETRQ